jgi:hypothetical protein
MPSGPSPAPARSRGRPVTGDVVGLRGDFLDELSAEVLERILELDLLGDRHTVVGDRGGAELLVEHHVAALRAERDADRVGELVDAGLERTAGLVVEFEQLGHGWLLSSRRSPARRGR